MKRSKFNFSAQKKNSIITFVIENVFRSEGIII